MEPYLFEISSEAGRKIGGIYTVLSSKSRHASKNFKDSYMFIGFYDESCSHDVKFSAPPNSISKIFEELAHLGIYCHYGHWLYAQNTPIILVDAKQFSQHQVEFEEAGNTKHDLQINYIKFLLWKHFGIDSLMERSYDFNENVTWGWAVGMLLEKLCRAEPFKSRSKIAHFHEWISGAAVLYARMKSLPLSSVFTTHATVLGRSLSSAGSNVLQDSLKSAEQIDISRAYELRVEGKHQLEMMASRKCDVFTTVSQSVAQEVRYILGKYPDVILLNGIDFEHHLQEGQVRDLSTYARQEILQLCEAALAPHYPSRLDNALLLFTSGRYEYVNKGFDIYLNALGKLNKELKKNQKDSKQIIAFVCAPSSTRGPKLSVIKNYLLIDKIAEVLDISPSQNSQKHYHNTHQRIEDTKSSIKMDLSTMYSGLIKEGARPPISLYNLNYKNDDVIDACLSYGLDNSKENPVKVFFYPAYLKPNDGLLNMDYNDVISGMDVGIFPSRYEPFGYTPLEAGLKRLISVSTDSAGLGRYLESKEDLTNRGVKILPMSAGADSAAQALAQFISEIYWLDPESLDQKKHDSYQLMHVFDWKDLYSNYLEAYELALQKSFGTNEEKSLVLSHKHPLTSVSQKVSALTTTSKGELVSRNQASPSSHASKKRSPAFKKKTSKALSKNSASKKKTNKVSKTKGKKNDENLKKKSSKKQKKRAGKSNNSKSRINSTKKKPTSKRKKKNSSRSKKKK